MVKENNLVFHCPNYRKQKTKIPNSRVAFFTSSWLEVLVDYIYHNLIRYSDYFVVTKKQQIEIPLLLPAPLQVKSLVIIWKYIQHFFLRKFK